jgi:hypothetical protein
MRVMLIAMLGSIMCVGACAGRTLRIDDTGDPMDGGTSIDQSGPIDLARPVDLSRPVDLAQPPGVGCATVLTCENNCTTQTCVDQCLMQGTPLAQKLFTVLQDCATKACTPSCSDPQSKACNDCFFEISTGTAADGQSGGPCVDSTMTPSMSPNCGACVDQLIACSSNM